ncbi:MAG: hypothetical protein MJE77_40235 [Proteobacteria bacterium]|nr:hypothetical protein [Pseudomonadota bacterium]
MRFGKSLEDLDERGAYRLAGSVGPIIGGLAWVFISEDGMDYRKWTPFIWTTISVLGITTALSLYSLLTRPKYFFTEEDWDSSFERFGGLVEFKPVFPGANPKPDSVKLSDRYFLNLRRCTKFAFYELSTDNRELHLVDYFYLHILRQMREQLHFLPVVLLTDYPEPHDKRSASNIKEDKEIRFTEGLLRTHLGRPFEVLRMSSISKRMTHRAKLDMGLFLPLSRRTINGLTVALREKRATGEVGTEREPTNEERSEAYRMIMRCSNAIFWQSVIKYRYAKAKCLVFVQSIRNHGLYSAHSKDDDEPSYYYVGVKNISLEGKEAKKNEAKKNEAENEEVENKEAEKPFEKWRLTRSQGNKPGFSTIRTWVTDNWGKREKRSDLETIVRLLAGREDVDEALKNANWPDNIERLIASYQLSYQAKSPEEEYWQGRTKLLVLELARIDKRISWPRKKECI